jgi:hypothetical protein
MSEYNTFSFSKVRFINTPLEGIAKSSPRTKELVINMHYWPRLKKEHQFFVLAHEEGHVVLKTRDEMEADDWAAKKYFEAGYKLSESVKALSEHLDRNNPVHIGRAWLQYNRALQYDWQHNQNANSFREQYETANTIKQKLLNKFYAK